MLIEVLLPKSEAVSLVPGDQKPEPCKMTISFVRNDPLTVIDEIDGVVVVVDESDAVTGIGSVNGVGPLLIKKTLFPARAT